MLTQHGPKRENNLKILELEGNRDVILRFGLGSLSEGILHANSLQTLSDLYGSRKYNTSIVKISPASIGTGKLIVPFTKNPKIIAVLIHTNSIYVHFVSVRSL
jgi:hypothetical protein